MNGVLNETTRNREVAAILRLDTANLPKKNGHMVSPILENNYIERILTESSGLVFPPL